MVLKNNSETNKESSTKKGTDEAAKQREIEEAIRRKEAEEKRREALLAEARKEKAIEEEKRESEKRREQQIKVEPISIKNTDGSVVVKDDHGRVVETKDAKGETRKFGYDDKGELNSFNENGKEWKSKDGQTWQSENEKPRTMRAVVNSEDGAFAKVEVNTRSVALSDVKTKKENPQEVTGFTDEKGKHWSSNDGQVWKAEGESERALKVTVDAGTNRLNISEAETTFAFVNGNTQTKTDSGSELRDKNNVVLESNQNTDTSDNVGKTADRPTLTVEQKQEQSNQAASIIRDNISDIKKVSDVLEPMTEAERTQLKETYKNLYNVDLQDELNSNLYKSDAAQCEALFKRKDGVPDNSGHIHQALAKLAELAPSEYAIYSGQDQPFTDGQVRAEKEVRDSLSTLTAAQITEVKTKYQNDYGRDLESDLMNDENLSVQTKEALKIILKGSDGRTDEDTLNLADYALKQRRPDIFNDVFRDATPAAREQFKAADGYKRIEAAYTDEYGGVNTADAQISKDFLDRGSASIATIAAGNTHWYHTNREDISRSTLNASEQDRKDFEKGEQLKLANETPKTPDEERALNYYNSVDTALHGAGDNREVAIWEAQLRNHGGFITEALSSRYEGFWFTGIGANTDKNKLVGSVENISKTDWQYLKSHPEELKNIERALGTFEDNHREEVMTMLENKVKADTFEQSQTIGNRDIEERLKDARDCKSRIDAIEGMSQQERQNYLNNAGGLKERLDQYFAPGTERERYAFNNIVHEVPGQTGPITRILLDDLKTGVKPAIVINHIEEAFKADPTLRERMANPQTEEDQKLSQWFHTSVERAVTNAGMGAQFTKKDGMLIEGSDKHVKEYENLVFNGGQVPLEKNLLLTSDNVERINIILHASDEDKTRLLNANPNQATKQFQDSVLGTTSEREVALYALSQRDEKGNGTLTDADRFRLFALGDKVDQDELRDKLAKMTPEQRQQLADEYYTKYHRLITSDAIEKVKEEDKWRFRELLSPTDISVRQIALDSQRALNSHTSDFDPVLKRFWDYSRVSADTTQDNLNKFVTEHAKELDKLTPEQRKQFDDAIKNFSEAQKNYINSKGEFAEAFVNATITVAAIGGALFTGGTSLTLLTAIGAGGAVYRVGMMKAIQGSDFDKSAKNIFKQGFEGGSAAMLGFMGPESFGLKGLMVGEKLAGQTARKLVTDVDTIKLFKEGSEEILTSTLAKFSRESAIVGEKEITALAEKIAAGGVDKSVVEQAIRNQLKTDVTTGIRNKLVNEAESYAKNMAAAQFGGGGKEILATAVGLEDPKTLLDRLANTTVSTAGGVSVFHFAFRGAASGFKTMNAIVGRDPEGIFIGKGTIVEDANGKRFQVTEERYRPKDGERIAEQVKESEMYPLELSHISDNPTSSGAIDSFTVEGQRLERGKTYTVGRSATSDILLADVQASRNHLQIRVDESGNRYLTDLNSSNGTTVNGKKIAPYKEMLLHPTDSVTVGEHQLKMAGGVQPQLLQVGATKMHLQPGQEIQVGRGIDGVSDVNVSANHAKVGRDEKGYYLIDESTNGTFVNRDGQSIKLPKGERFYVREGEEFGLGKSLESGGERLTFALDKVLDVPLPPMHNDFSPSALKQSNDYGQRHQLEDQIEDGWSTAGGDARFSKDGSFTTRSKRPAMVIDRANDPYLRAALDEAKTLFGHLPPRERVEALTKWAKQKLTPADMNEESLDNWYNSFSNERDGERIFFGEFLKEGKGVCSQQAILLKLAADQFPDLSSTLVRGNYFVPGKPDGGGLNHVWTEFTFADSKPLVYDPRGKIFGENYKEGRAYLHTPGRDFAPGINKPVKLSIGDKISYDDTPSWKVRSIVGDQAIISHDGTKFVSKEDVAILNRGKGFKVGVTYHLARSNGTIDDGWTLMGVSKSGKLEFFKKDADIRTVPLSDLGR